MFFKISGKSVVSKEKASIQAKLSEANLQLAQQAEEIRRLELEYQTNKPTLADATLQQVTNDGCHHPNL